MRSSKGKTLAREGVNCRSQGQIVQVENRKALLSKRETAARTDTDERGER